MIRFLFALGILFFSLNQGMASDWKSADRIRFEALSAKALIEGKSIFVKLSAAWCGPCAVMDQYLTDHAAELKPGMDRYEFFSAEDMFMELGYLTDFLPVEAFDFPKLYLFNPANGVWTSFALEIGEPAEIVADLQKFADGQSLAESYTAKYQALLASGAVFNDSEESKFEILGAALLTTLMEKTPADFARFAKSVRDAQAADPARYPSDPDWGLKEILNRYYDLLLSRGTSTVAELQAIDPVAFTDFSNGSEYYGFVYDFQIQIGALYRRAGLDAVAAQCPSIAAAANAKYTGVEYNGYGSVVTNREIFCAQVAFLAGAVGKEAALAKVAAIDAEERKTAGKRLATFYAAVGEWDLAIEGARQSRDKWLSVYAARPNLVERITVAAREKEAAYEAHRAHPQ